MNTNQLLPATVGVRAYPDGRLDTLSAAVYLGLSPKTLAQMRTKGTGPEFVRVGGKKVFLSKGCPGCFYRSRPRCRGSAKSRPLEKAGRVADLLEFGELMRRDALEREESCGGHFRVEHQTEDGEARRDDERFCHVSAWKYQGPDRAPVLHREPLTFENVHLSTRSYK